MVNPLRFKKASLDLSVGFLVRLIMAIVVFGFGILIVRNIFSSAESGDLTRNIDVEVEEQIRLLMDSGESILVFPEEIRTSRNKVASFGLGVLNKLEMPGVTKFSIKVECYRFIPHGGVSEESCPELSETWTFSDYPEMEVRNNDEGTVAIPVLASDASKGTYVYNVIVDYHNDAMDLGGRYGITKFRLVIT